MDLKQKHLIMYVILSLLSLPIGFFSGRIVSYQAKAASFPNVLASSGGDYPVPDVMMEYAYNDPVISELSSTGSPPLQQNILVIGIDHMDSPTPRLESIWLVLYFSDSPHLTWMPIYPAYPAENQNTLQINQKLANLFQLNQSKKPTQSFQEALHQQNLWWNGIVVLDKIAVTYLFEILAKSKNNPLFTDDYLVQFSLLPSVWDNPGQAMKAQTNLLYSLCLEVSQFQTLPDLFSQPEVIKNHVSADFDLVSFISQWQLRLAQGNRLICEFPFLSVP